MSSKDKARELFEKYYTIQHKTIICSEGYAKQCALICVDEILSFIEDADPQTLSYELIGYRDYWREVLTEIENL